MLKEMPHLELIATHAVNAVIITNPEGLITWVNTEAEHLTGYSASELEGYKPSSLLQGPETDTEVTEVMRQAIAAHEPFEVTIANYTKTGLLYWVQISCRPFYDKAGGIEGFISTQADVTRLRRLSEFNRMHAAVNQLVISSDYDLSFIKSICDLAVRHAHVQLAWMGRPDQAGQFKVLAASGQAISYLEDISISVDPGIPDGRGPIGITWRTGQPYYNESFLTNEAAKPWLQRARSCGLYASATLPVFRDEVIWASFSLYYAHSLEFDNELCAILDTLAQDISYGLNQIDLRARERRLKEQLYEEKQLAQFTLLSIEDAVVTADVNGRITSLNPKARSLTGWEVTEVIGVPVAEVLRFIDMYSGNWLDNPIETVLQTKHTLTLGSNTLLRNRGGVSVNIEGAVSPIYTQQEEVEGCVVVFRDVTQRYELHRQLEWQATHDPLTELPNRFALENHLQASIAEARTSGKCLAVGFIDLDDFKPVNDQYGHEMGDVLIKTLCQRLKEKLSGGDFIARLAGDEFVVIVDGLEPDSLDETLESIFARLHETVESPFYLKAGEQVFIDMSMGISIYPRDAEDVDKLLRQADAAMYVAKEDKYSRATWWRKANFSLSEYGDHESMDAYGRGAADLLEKALFYWDGLEREVVDAFYTRIWQRASAKRILSLLSESEFEQLKANQAEHLTDLISSNLAASAHQEMSSRVGEVHAMVGIETSDIIAAMEDYGRLLRNATQKLPWRIDARLALDSIVQSRLAAEIYFQSIGSDQIYRNRVSSLTELETRMQDWLEDGEFAEQLCQYLSKMPGVSGAVIGRPDAADNFVLEFEANMPNGIRHALSDGSQLTYGHFNSPEKAWRKAWLSGQVEICDRSSAHASSTEELFVRSAVYLPIVDTQGHSILIVAIFGNYPAQFSQLSMRMWLESVQHMVTPAFQRAEKAGSEKPIDVGTRQKFHSLLFSHRVQILAHPIVSLATGLVEKVEMLARLQYGDKLIVPGEFLPSFGKQDLQVLFRKVLRQTAESIVKWDKQGLFLDASINVPPSVLVSGDCVAWVDEVLNEYKLEPNRFDLELLETEDEAGLYLSRDENMSRLAEMGLHLVMDDLGSGYSSLNRMRLLPFHSVKIDQALVRDALSAPEKIIPFIGSLVRTAQALGLEVVIEGLETLEMVDMAANLKAEYGQGYAFARPMLPDALVDWIRHWHASFIIEDLKTPLGDIAEAFINHNWPSAYMQLGEPE
ncbi:diguanylate cyclase domain-containing protein [Acidihalobacter prosperus]